MQTIKGISHGKINLFLSVTGAMPDGYHSLETIYQSVMLGDEISLSFHDRGGISLRTNLKYIPRDSRNVAVKAAELFFQETGIENGGMFINIKKVIPVGGGMAGGSTNAAAVLRMLNSRYGQPLPMDKMMDMGLSLGADVPFCIAGGSMSATGKGEKMQRIPPMPPCWLLLCKPNVSVSTKKAFELLDAHGVYSPPGMQNILDALESGDLNRVCSQLHNDFEPVIFAQYPRLRTLKEKMLENGAIAALMTGTGSVVFGVFDTQETAVLAADKLRSEFKTLFVTTPLK